MAFYLVIGFKTFQATSPSEVIYSGGSGDEAEKAIAAIPAGKFVRAERLMNPRGIPVRLPQGAAVETPQSKVTKGKSMKSALSAAAAMVLFLVGMTADAEQIQRYNGPVTTSYNGGTNVIPAVSTNRYISIDVPKVAGDVILLCNYKFHAAPSSGDATSLSIQLFRGIAPDSFETNAYLTWVPTGNSTTPSASILTTNVSGIPYIRARFIGYSTNAIATNVTLSYGFKN